MAFLKFAKAVVQKVNIPGKEWEGITARAGRDTFSDRTSKVAIQNYHPDKYLLTHSTIICSVDTEEPPNVKVGEVTEGSRKINRKYADYWITPETLAGINSNMDAWERNLLLATYRTFIGAENYCFAPDTKVLMADGSYKPIVDVVVGDEVITHTGKVKPVVHKFVRDYVGTVEEVYVGRFEKPIVATPNHPFYHLNVEAPEATRYNGSKKSSSDRYYKDQITSFLRDGETCLGGRLAGLKSIVTCLKEFPDSTNKEIQQKTGLQQSCIDAYFRKYPDAFSSRVLKKGEMPEVKGKPRRARRWSLSDESSLPVMEIKVEVKKSPISDINESTFLVSPAYIPSTQERVGLDRAVLLGYYMAEGCQSHPTKDKGIVLSFGPHEESLADDAIERLNRAFPTAKVSKVRTDTTLAVKANDSDTAKWFRDKGGHLAPHKRLSPDVLTWSQEELLWLISSWVTGDGNIHTETSRIRGATTSEQLAYQMRHVADLCGIKSTVVFEPQEIGKVSGSYEYTRLDGTSVNSPIICRNHLWNLVVSSGSINKIIEHSKRWDGISYEKTTKRSEFSRWDNHRVFPVSRKEQKKYAGKVYNIEVADDHSYVVDYGVAVANCEHIQVPELSKGKIIDAVARDLGDHIYVDILTATDRKHTQLVKDIESGKMAAMSMGCTIQYSVCTKCGNVAHDETDLCDHIRYEKGNTFIRPDGKKGVIAELCGHSSSPDSVQFIEASWVENPAFKGAVTHNILNMGSTTIVDSEEFQAKIKSAFENPAQDVDWTSFFQKTARQEAVRMLKKAFEFDEGGEEEGGAETTEEGLLDEVKNQIKDKVKNQIIKDLKNELSDKEEKPRIVPEQEEHLNENMIQSSRYASFKKKYASHLGPRTKTAYLAYTLLDRGTLSKHKHKFANQDLVAAHYLYDHERGNGLQKSLYKALYKVGGVSGYKSAREFVSACTKALGRQPTKAELVVLIKRAKTLNPKG